MNITDKINLTWVDKIERLADKLERGEKVYALSNFTNDQLHYLIYWNFGYSGIATSDYTIVCEDELNSRGIRYNEKLAQLIVDKVEELY
jgi:hypothetical protein